MVSCGKCTPKANCAMGRATECGHTCTSRGYKWCAKCALQRRVCQACGGVLPPKKGGKKPRKKGRKR